MSMLQTAAARRLARTLSRKKYEYIKIKPNK